MIGTPPVIQLLRAMDAAGSAAIFPEQALSGGTMTIRHARNRKPVRSEKPCITLILVDDDRQQADVDRNEWETVREMTVDLQCDLSLSTEDSGRDPTGLEALLLVLGTFLAALRDPDQPNLCLGGLCDDITVGAIDPDEDSTPDEGRMTRRVTVLYRVRTDDPNVLLAAGANG